ncbi:MAG: hypothetical protein CVU19_09480 [Betaproteobacteria bacterium HGW-Betaproteobacteria-13]|nr:MAG: hypothetical protein CVU19_09480 [Betaproteobacteria bacterium HGW-Betaproteobacteria-13]
MTAALLNRLGHGLRASMRMRFDAAAFGLGASSVGALSAPLTRLLSDESGTFAWLVDLIAHWQWLYVVAGGVCAAILLRRRPAVLVLLATGLIGIGWSGATTRADSATPGSGPALTIATANLELGQASLDDLAHWIGGLGADLVVLQEVSKESARRIAQWQDYPHQLVTADEGPFGLAILSRTPLTGSEALESLQQPLRYRSFISWQGHRIGISAIHPMPPISPTYHQRRVEMLTEEAQWSQLVSAPSIVAGDLNSTPWSSALASVAPAGLLRATGLRPTWPAILPVIPIDHILINDAWQVVESGVGPNIGSDHRPAFAVLSLKAQAIHAE